MSMTSQSTDSSPSILPANVRDDFPILDQRIHRDRPLVYLDNAASSQRPNAVLEAMDRCYQTTYANVHRGIHWLSEQASAEYEQARRKVRQFINASHFNEIIFTSGTTAGINLVARSWGDQNLQPGDEILLTIFEHHSNIVPWQQLAERTGARIQFVGISADGMLDLDDLRRKINHRTRVLAFAAVSNVLGTEVPVQQIVEIARQQNIVTVVDAAQHVPHASIDVQQWQADFVAFSGHKMLGPTGIGVLYGRQEWLRSIPPFLGGGSMIDQVTVDGFTPGELPAKFEAGTPPIVEAIGLGAAIDYLGQLGLDAIGAHARTLAQLAYQKLESIEGLRILGPPAEQRCGLVSFVVDGVSPQDISILLDQQGVAIRAGHHCAMPLHQQLEIKSSCRASFYLYNTVEEVGQFVDALQTVLAKLR